MKLIKWLAIWWDPHSFFWFFLDESSVPVTNGDYWHTIPVGFFICPVQICQVFLPIYSTFSNLHIEVAQEQYYIMASNNVQYGLQLPSLLRLLGWLATVLQWLWHARISFIIIIWWWYYSYLLTHLVFLLSHTLTSYFHLILRLFVDIFCELFCLCSALSVHQYLCFLDLSSAFD